LGSFYRFFNGKLSCRPKSGVGPLKAKSGELIVDDAKKAEMLNNYFTSVFTDDDGTLPYFTRRVDDCVDSSVDIVKVMTQMKSTNTADPQGINNAFLKRLKFTLSKPLKEAYTYIFFSCWKIPSDWHVANVTPVSKKVCPLKSQIIALFLSLPVLVKYLNVSSSNKFWLICFNSNL